MKKSTGSSSEKERVLRVNGVERSIDDIDPDTPLLWVLRDHLEMTGTKFGCGMALCGACTVHVDGKPIRSCSIPLQAVRGHEITTIEGVSGVVADAVRLAWTDCTVPQCGTVNRGKSCLRWRSSERIRDPMRTPWMRP